MLFWTPKLHSVFHSLTHSLTHSLVHSTSLTPLHMQTVLIHSFIHTKISLIHSNFSHWHTQTTLSRPFTCSLQLHSFTHIHSRTLICIQISLSHLYTQISLSHLHTQTSLSHSLTPSLTLTHILIHLLTQNFSHSFTHMHSYSLTHTHKHTHSLTDSLFHLPKLQFGKQDIYWIGFVSGFGFYRCKISKRSTSGYRIFRALVEYSFVLLNCA